MAGELRVRPYEAEDLPALAEIWNQIVGDGVAYPQEEALDKAEAAAFFAGQSRTAVAELDGKVVGLYILHPNNVGRCGHIANASYGVSRDCRGRGVGRALVEDSLAACGALGFRLLQFNAVVASNLGAIALYQSLGFQRVGTIPGGFRLKDGRYEDIIVFYHRV